MPENYDFSQMDPSVSRQETLGKYTAKTFGLMFLGLLVTFGIAYYLGCTVKGWFLFRRTLLALPEGVLNYLPLILAGAELLAVIILSARVHKMAPVTAAVWFFVYAILNGLTFTFIFIGFEMSTLALVFGFTALYFGGMAVFGFFTNVDLSRLRNVLIGGAIALVVMNILMMFMPRLDVLDRVLCTVGVIIFLAFTAYDTQKIKSYYYGFQGDDAMLKKASIISALELYLDFINLFLYLLRLFGKAKKN